MKMKVDFFKLVALLALVAGTHLSNWASAESSVKESDARSACSLFETPTFSSRTTTLEDVERATRFNREQTFLIDQAYDRLMNDPAPKTPRDSFAPKFDCNQWWVLPKDEIDVPTQYYSLLKSFEGAEGQRCQAELISYKQILNHSNSFIIRWGPPAPPYKSYDSYSNLNSVGPKSVWIFVRCQGENGDVYRSDILRGSLQ
jgi:hypothetical protein